MNTKELFFAYHEANDEAKRLRAELVAQLKTDPRLKLIDLGNSLDNLDFWDYGFEQKFDHYERCKTDPDDFTVTQMVNEFKFTKDGFYFDKVKRWR